MNLAFYRRTARLLRTGRAVVVATLVGRHGSTPRDFGAKMLIADDGSTEFSIGGGAFEALVVEDARQALATGRGFEKTYRFAEDGEDALGMVCGGQARVLFEVVRPPLRLFVFGAGHIGRALVRQGFRLGFDVTLVDDRPHLLDPSRHPRGVTMIRVEHDFLEGLPSVPAGAYVAIVTRCHRTDLAVVRHAVGRGASYVGLIGSRRKVAVVKERAQEAGIPDAALAELHAPIGLPIGAETPEEIAVSIAAEIVAIRRTPGEGAGSAKVTPLDRSRSGRRAP
jgi:xanthine dehydrogenase accessory factor